MSSSKTIKSRIIQRTDTQKNWSDINPVLSCGEIAFIKTDDDILMKVGNGNFYNEIPFFSNVKIDNANVSSFNVLNIPIEEYSILLSENKVDKNTLYIISSDNTDNFGRRLINLADPELETDAVNKQYVDNISVDLEQKINDIEIPSKTSQLENDSNYALSSVVSSEFTIVNDNIENLSVDLSSKIKLNDNSLSSLNIYKVTSHEYHELVTSESIDESAIYIVSSDIQNAYGQRIENVGDAVEDTDATNKGYVDSIVYNLSNDIKSNYVSSTIYNESVSELSDNDVYLLDEIQNKININGINIDSLSIVKINQNDYHELIISENVLSNTLYVISSDTLNMYGEKITNLSDPEQDTDAVNKKYVDNISVEIYEKITENITDDVEDISSDLSIKIKLNDNALSTLDIYKVTTDEYHDLVVNEQINESALYIVSSDILNMYGQKIQNVGDAVEDTDATNKGYVDLAINNLSNEVKSTYVFSSTFDKTISSLNDTFNTSILELADNDTYLFNEIQNKVNINGTNINSLSIIKIDEDIYHELVISENILSNALYVISSDTLNMYGEKIVNLADPTEDTDAVNKQYVDKKMSSIKQDSDLSVFFSDDADDLNNISINQCVLAIQKIIKSFS